MLPVLIRFTYTRDVLYVRRMVRTMSRGRWLTAVYPAAAALVSVLCFISGNGIAVLAGLVSLVLAAGITQLLDTARRRALQLPPHLLEPTLHILSDETVAASSASCSTTRSWATLTRATELPSAYIFSYLDRTYVDIPRAGLTPEQDEQLRTLLVERRLLRPSDGWPLSESGTRRT